MNEKQTEGFSNRPPAKSPFRPAYILGAIMLFLCLFAVFSTEFSRLHVSQPAPPPPGTDQPKATSSRVNAKVPAPAPGKPAEIPFVSVSAEETPLSSKERNRTDLRNQDTSQNQRVPPKQSLVAYPLLPGTWYDNRTPSALPANVLLPGQASIADRINITTAVGVVYENCAITRAEPDGISVRHLCGVAKIPFPELPPEYAQAYDYDPDEAREYAEEMARKQQVLRAASQDTAQVGASTHSGPSHQVVPQSTPHRSISPRYGSSGFSRPFPIRKIGESDPSIRRIGEDDPNIRKIGE